jgi:hypothetical protein
VERIIDQQVLMPPAFLVEPIVVVFRPEVNQP